MAGPLDDLQDEFLGDIAIQMRWNRLGEGTYLVRVSADDELPDVPECDVNRRLAGEALLAVQERHGPAANPERLVIR